MTPDLRDRGAAEPTARQLSILRFIADRIEADGYPPSIRELGIAFEILSTNAVNDHLKALERKGLIERDRETARGLRITKRGKSLVGGGA